MTDDISISTDAQLYAYNKEYNEKIEKTVFEEKLKNDFNTKIKFAEKNTIIIGNPEGLNIKNIINSCTKEIDLEKDNIVILGNIIDSSFSKNPQLSKDLGNDDVEKLFTYYRNIIEKKSYNDSNIDFCNKENVTFIIGNREIDKIKIKDLVELNIEYNTIDDYILNRETVVFKIEDISTFYPFWVKFYFKDSYKISKDFKFIRRFKKIFKAIDAEMLLFTIYYELNKNAKNSEELLKELTNLAIIYFYKMKNYESGKIDTKFKLLGDTEVDKFNSLDIIDRLDYLAYCVFKYFYKKLSNEGNLYKLLNKAEFILTLKVSDKYYLLSHGGITRKMFIEKSKGTKPYCIEKLESFIKKYKNTLTNISLIRKLDKDIVKLHNTAKSNQIKYYDSIYGNGECNIINDIEIDFEEIETNIQTSTHYNLLLYYSLTRNISGINKLLSEQQQGGYKSEKQTSYKGLINDLLVFDSKKQIEINQYNKHFKKIIEDTLIKSTDDDNKPSNDLMLLLMMAHSFNTKIFNELLEQIETRISEVNSIKSKDCSVIINTIFDHRINHIKEHVLFENVQQITANSNNTTQPSEAIYDYIFYGTLIDCYETIMTTGNEHNYIISIDNTSIIKHYSKFDSYSCLIIAPDLKNILNKDFIAVKTLIQTSKYQNIPIYDTLGHIYYILNYKIRNKYNKLKYKFICPRMNYYGIDDNKILVFSDSKIKHVEFHGYNFESGINS